MNTIQAREIKNIPYGGSVNPGQGISFILQFQDDTYGHMRAAWRYFRYFSEI
jgi:hypothetical protein